jgi:hypothetical protein
MNRPEFGKYKIELWNKLFENVECTTIDKYYSNWTNIQNLNDQCIAYKKAITGQIIPLSAIHKDIKFNFNNRNFIKIYSNLYVTIGLRNDGSIELFFNYNLENIIYSYLFNYDFIKSIDYSSSDILYDDLDTFEQDNYISNINLNLFNKSRYQFKEIYIKELYFIGILADDKFIIVCLNDSVLISVCSKLYLKYNSTFNDIQIQNIICTDNFIFILTNKNKLIYFKINNNHEHNIDQNIIDYLDGINIDNEYKYIYFFYDLLYLLDINNKIVKDDQIIYPDHIMKTEYKKIIISDKYFNYFSCSIFVGLTIYNNIDIYIYNDIYHIQNIIQKINIQKLKINAIFKSHDNYIDIIFDDNFNEIIFIKLDNTYIIDRNGELVKFDIPYKKKIGYLQINLDNKISFDKILANLNKELYLKIKDYNFLDISYNNDGTNSKYYVIQE